MKRYLFSLLLICSQQAYSQHNNYVENKTFINKGTSVVFSNSKSEDDMYSQTATDIFFIDEGNKAVSSTQYFDGLGRPTLFMKNGIGQSPDLFNYTLQEYDSCGRASISWLPKPSSDTFLGSDCSVTTYDALDRPVFVTTPGEDMNGRGKTIAYTTNEAVKRVKRYKVGEGGKLVENGYYPPCSLTGELITDEDNNSVEIFKDFMGNVVLERRDNTNDTYYVYDNKFRLTYVLSPMYQDTPNTDMFAYYYEYDDMGNIAHKKLPGCNPKIFHYNSYNLLSYYQDAQLADSNLVRICIYDSIGRLLYQVLREDRKRSTKQVSLNDVVPECPDFPQYEDDYEYYDPDFFELEDGDIIEIANYYDNYGFLWLTPAYDIITNMGFSENTTICTTSLLTGRMVRTSNGNYLYTVLCYDKKGNITCCYETLPNGAVQKTETTYSFTNKPTKVCSTLKKDENTFIVTDTYNYSPETDMLLSKVTSCNGATSEVEYTYDDFNNILSKTYNKQESLTTEYSYNVRKWITKIQNPLFTEELHYTDGEGTPCYNGNISSMIWNIRGTYPYHRYNFKYDDLNRMTQADYYYLGSDMTEMSNEKRYDESVEYNRNSAPTHVTRHGRTNKTNTYDIIDNLTYSYNGNQLNSISDACTKTLSYNGSFEFADKNKTSDEYEYDANGNLTKDMNKGISEITYDACNQPRTIKFDGGKLIKYVYSVDGRKLSVTYISPLENLSNASANAFTATFDAVTAVEEPKLVSGTGTFSTVSSSQKGDTSSPSKSGIEASANKMNLSSIDKIVFVAPELEKAIGWKINLVSNISVTEYVGNFIFENGNLTTCLTDDGYMSFTSAGKPEFHYYIKDHLGSNRVVADENGNIEQKTHYYAYGGIIGDISTNPETQKYKYNGKEYDTMHGLNTYDYGARQYDPARITWDRMDQLCEKYYHINPYVYCGGNPIRFIDPDGRFIVIAGENNTAWYYNMQNQCFVNSNGDKYSGNNEFINNVTNQLNTLSKGDEGNALVSFLVKNTQGVQIVPSKQNLEDAWSNDNLVSGIVSGIRYNGQSGSENGTAYTALGHELAHSQDRMNGTLDMKTWYVTDEGKQVPQAEKFATFVENKIRAEHKIPLRRTYVENKDNGSPEVTSIIDSKRRSLYFSTNGDHLPGYKRVNKVNRYIFP